MTDRLFTHNNINCIHSHTCFTTPCFSLPSPTRYGGECSGCVSPLAIPLRELEVGGRHVLARLLGGELQNASAAVSVVLLVSTRGL